jgi:hypothetical protein
MKKVISLGITSAMVASISSVSFANKAAEGNFSINDLKPYVLSDGAERMDGAEEKKFTVVDFRDGKYEDAVQLTVETGHKKTVVFGLSKTCPFAKYDKKVKPLTQVVYPANTSGQTAIKKGNNLMSGIAAAVNVSVSTSTKVYAGQIDQASVCAVTFEGTNSTKTDRYSVWPITLKDAKGGDRVVNFCIEVPGINKEDAYEADVDLNEDSVREYNNGTALRNGEYITTANLRKMKELGSKYMVKSANGIEIRTAISKATVEAGDIKFSAEIKTDAKLSERYADEKGKIFRVAIPAFEKEKRTVNILAGESVVSKVLGTELSEKIGNNLVKTMYAYPINADGYDKLASASGNDGIIDTSAAIAVKVVDERIVFDMPAGVTDVMLSTVEIDTTKLAAVPGVSVPETSSEAAVNEIVAPTIGETTSVVPPVVSEVSTPAIEAPFVEAPAESVESQAKLEKAPAGTIAQNTGANDIVTMAIALTAILVAAAAVRSRKAN